MHRSPHRSNCKFIRSAFAVLLTAALLLSGCGDSSKPSEDADTPQASAISTGQPSGTAASSNEEGGLLGYRVTERFIPDPETTLLDAPELKAKFPPVTEAPDAKLTLSLQDSFSTDGVLLLLYKIVYITEEYEEVPSFGYCLSVLEPPYEQFSNYTFSAELFGELQEDSSILVPFVTHIVSAGREGVYLYLSDSIGLYSGLDNSRHLDEIEMGVAPARLALYPAGETLYAVSPYSGGTFGSFTTYDEDLNPVLTQNLEHSLSGCLSSGSETLWYGFDSNGSLGVWDKPNGTRLFSLGNMVADSSDFLLARAPGGGFVLADTSSVWTGTGDEPLQKILSFSQKGYILQELLAISVDQDDRISLIVRFEDKLCLLTLEQTDTPDKQVITVVCSISGFDGVIAAFNRQNENYQVVLVNPFESGDIDAYRRQLQLDLSAGGGPDLLEPWLIDLEGGIRNGFLEPLDDVVENPEDYWPAALESGKWDGVQYAIPYHMVLSFLVASESLAGGQDSWTLAQMMDAVQGSPAQALQKDLDSLDIVLEYGLKPHDNPSFIDYEAGVSHLAEQPFIDFLEFAKEYGDDLYYSADESEAAEYYQDGRLAVHLLEMTYPNDLLFARSCFQDREVLIGMPAAGGRGVYMEGNQFCLSSNSQCKEGAKEFLRYLISEEGQTKLVRSNNEQYGPFIPDIFSCRRDVTEQSLQYYQENVPKGGSNERLGVRTEYAPLDETQLEQFRALFEDARPAWDIPSAIYDMVSEELSPYFAGDCSAQEAAEKLNNRVQLYFDEQ
ncbi:MAG: extracellular solute-binding protein [Firmicutes bacterium]|nr:extracellular solute-binding protein [Bacillota bacterium]